MNSKLLDNATWPHTNNYNYNTADDNTQANCAAMSVYMNWSTDAQEGPPSPGLLFCHSQRAASNTGSGSDTLPRLFCPVSLIPVFIQFGFIVSSTLQTYGLKKRQITELSSAFWFVKGTHTSPFSLKWTKHSPSQTRLNQMPLINTLACKLNLATLHLVKY